MNAKTTPPDDELAKLRKRVQELESEVASKDRELRERGRGPRYTPPPPPREGEAEHRTSARRETRRVASDVSDTASRKSELATRAIRGATLASLDAVRLFADSISGLVDGALDRNRPRDRDDTVNELSRRLPSDFSASLVDAVDELIDIPARAASRFAETYSEAEYRRHRSRRHDDDNDDDEERHTVRRDAGDEEHSTGKAATGKA
jgi:hypothetical protein